MSGIVSTYLSRVSIDTNNISSSGPHQETIPVAVAMSVVNQVICSEGEVVEFLSVPTIHLPVKARDNVLTLYTQQGWVTTTRDGSLTSRLEKNSGLLAV